MHHLQSLSSDHHLAVTTRDDFGVRIVALVGDADLDTEDHLSAELRAAEPRSGGMLVLDLTELTFCSAAALGVLADMVGHAVHNGTAVAVVGLATITSRVWLLTDVPIPMQFATIEQAIATMSAVPAPVPDLGPVTDAGSARLLAERDALRRVMTTHAVIEQAKGMLMERLSCTSLEALDLITEQARRSDRKLLDLAADQVWGRVLDRLPHRHGSDLPLSEPDPDPAA